MTKDLLWQKTYKGSFFVILSFIPTSYFTKSKNLSIVILENIQNNVNALIFIEFHISWYFACDMNNSYFQYSLKSVPLYIVGSIFGMRKNIFLNNIVKYNKFIFMNEVWKTKIKNKKKILVFLDFLKNPKQSQLNLPNCCFMI